ncbi:hypothetical protein MRB53_008119 [Persea americana]|uniref:Uncharacterized protein n=1 Tax=Persea americana TaxID=3435 RepID=A0ACC2MLT0_PERAE|nr:hypothetical protein MRB53_008119 [Persea americana]
MWNPLGPTGDLSVMVNDLNGIRASKTRSGIPCCYYEHDQRLVVHGWNRCRTSDAVDFPYGINKTVKNNVYETVILSLYDEFISFALKNAEMSLSEAMLDERESGILFASTCKNEIQGEAFIPFVLKIIRFR